MNVRLQAEREPTLGESAIHFNTRKRIDVTNNGIDIIKFTCN